MNYYLEKMIELDADGIDFIFIEIEELKRAFRIYKSYTREEFQYVNAFPKTGYKYWKIINGKKTYVD